MKKRPFLLLACTFLAGVLCSMHGMIVSVCALLLILYAQPWKEKGVRKWMFAVGLPLFFFLGWFHTNHECAFRERYLQELSDGQEVQLAGRVVRVEEKSRYFYYYLTDCNVNLSGKNVPCNDVLAYCSSDESSIGQIMVLQGTISLFDEAANEGGFDARTFYRSQKIDFGLWVEQVCAVWGKPDPYRNGLVYIRQRLKQVIDKSVDDDGVLAAMLLGEKSGLDAEIKSLYQRAGISHILAISGLHVSLLGMGVYHLLRRRCGFGYPMAAVWTAFFMLSYAIMSGNSISTRRAVGMLLVYLLADVLGRAYDLLSALGVVFIVLLWENPFLTGYSGFLFSVAAVLGIGVGASVFREWRAVCLKEESCDDRQEETKHGKDTMSLRQGLQFEYTRILQEQKNGLWTSFAIQLFTLPLVAYYYYEIPIYAMVLNFFVLAFISRLMGLAVTGAVLGLLVPAAGRILLAPCGWILWLYHKCCLLFTGLPGACYISGKPDMWKILVYYVMLAGGMYLLWLRTRRQREKGEKTGLVKKKKWVLRFGSCVAVIFFVLLFPQKKEFEMDVLDVGQGDGIYLCTSDGVSFFIDGGSTDVKNVGDHRILPFLKSKGVKEISYWFISHTDEDHISGIQEVLVSGYRIKNLVVAEAAAKEERTMKLVQLAEDVGTEVLYMEAGDFLFANHAKIQCLYPAADAEAEDINDLCLVLRFEDCGTSALFAGDLSAEVEESLVEKGLCAKVDFYKADHHGSKYSSSTTFLHALMPELTVASAGEGNRYGHPGAEAVERIRESGSRFLCTIESGQVKICRNKEGVMIVEN